MSEHRYPSEIRDSQIRALTGRVKKQNYKQYLLAVRLEKVRVFNGASIRFDFPVTALIGPNGGGKSTILGAIACAYRPNGAESFFPRNSIGDDLKDIYTVELEAIDKSINPKGTIRTTLLIGDTVRASEPLKRELRHFNVSRTLPAIEDFRHTKRMMRDLKNAIVATLAGTQHPSVESIEINDVRSFDDAKREAQTILGRSLEEFRLVQADVVWRKPHTGSLPTSPKKRKKYFEVINPATGHATYYRRGRVSQRIFVGKNKHSEYSEFNFGAGESSVLRLVNEIEALPDYSLVLIEELENGLHPVATRRLVEYLIGVAERKKVQVVFTTHSDSALDLLPPEGIWAAIDGSVQQGKLTVESLRAVTGRIDRRLAIFVEDLFAKHWVESILRETLSTQMEEIGVYAIGGDGNAVTVQKGHRGNPSIPFHSICILDGDSKQGTDPSGGIYRLPGEDPETTIFNAVVAKLEQNIALLTVACQRPPAKQEEIAQKIREVSRVCRDPHNLFSRVGMEIGFVPEAVVRGAFLSIWMQEHPNEVADIVTPIRHALALPPRRT